MFSVLNLLGNDVTVVYAIHAEEAVNVINACFSFNFDDVSDIESSNGDDEVHVLAGVVMGITVAENLQKQVREASSQGPYPVMTCCCKPSDVAQYFLLHDNP